MSGGTFDHTESHMREIAEYIEEIIKHNDDEDLDCYGDRIGKGFDASVIAKFKETVEALNRAHAMVRRVDYLLACDDGEESFHNRWNEEVPAAWIKGIHPNDRVMLKPTSAGVALIKASVDKTNALIADRSRVQGTGIEYPVPDEDGYIYGQYWCLMSKFNETGWGGDVLFTDLKPAPVIEYCYKTCPNCGSKHRTDYSFGCCTVHCVAEYGSKQVAELAARIKELEG
jgi:hypothetical protein